MFTQLVILAQQEGGNNPGGRPPGLIEFAPFLVLFVLLYLIVLRPMSRRQERERQERLANLQKNDEVLTAAGIYGTVTDISDKEDVITVKVADNVRLKMTKASIIQNLSQEERIKAEKEKAKAHKSAGASAAITTASSTAIKAEKGQKGK